MSTIRPLQQGDLTAVANLYEQVMRSGSRHAPPGLAPAFARTFIDHPWTDSDIPSLVYEDGGGSIVGFIGSNVRRLKADGRSLRMGCSGPLLSEPAVRNRAVGALLLRAYLQGPQDLSITDGATRTVQQIWERLGGQTAHLHCITWTHLFKPWLAGADRILARRVTGGWQRRLRPLWRLLDAPTTRMASRAVHVERPATTAQVLTPAALVAQLSTAPEQLRPDYDETFLEWLFDEMAQVTSWGPLVRRLVRAPDGQVLGWYVAYLPPGRIGQAVQIAAPGGDVDSVVDHLFREAQDAGVSALQGRLEAHLMETLSQRRCILERGDRALIHSRDPGLLAAIALGHATLSRMEGEWWMGHHLESFA